MRILHTSDWHIGRSFHGYSTLDNLGVVLDALVDVVLAQRVDVVAVAGDIFDSATPSAESYELLTRVLGRIREAGAVVVMTSGNHDSATRLGFNAGFTGLAGIHIITRHELHDQPITITDDHGPVRFYGIPFLEPALVRHHYPNEPLRTHEQVLSFVMGRVRADIAVHGERSVVLSHAFIANVTASDVERDISAGGLDLVPLSVFDGPDYVALGHIHGRAELSTRARYSGAPLHFSFSEATKPRGAWLVELDSLGLSSVEWIDLPVPRRLTALDGDLESLLTDPSLVEFESDWISAVITDQTRPLDAMRKLRARFPFAAALEYRPAITAPQSTNSYAARLASRSDVEIIGDFLELVRNGKRANDDELQLINDVVSESTRAGSTA